MNVAGLPGHYAEQRADGPQHAIQLPDRPTTIAIDAGQIHGLGTSRPTGSLGPGAFPGVKRVYELTRRTARLLLNWR